jgi:hypothetical protein
MYYLICQETMEIIGCSEKLKALENCEINFDVYNLNDLEIVETTGHTLKLSLSIF